MVNTPENFKSVISVKSQASINPKYVIKPNYLQKKDPTSYLVPLKEKIVYDRKYSN
jgi:hypothetical protein